MQEIVRDEAAPSKADLVDERTRRVVKFANIAIVVASVAVALVWVIKSGIRSHFLDMLLLIVPCSVSAILLALPRGSRFRDAWCLAAFAMSPVAISFLAMETSLEYASYREAPGDALSLELQLGFADLVLWIAMLLMFMAVSAERQFHIQKELAAKVEEKDRRIIVLEKSLASLQRRVAERDGYA